jgi:hypothetical protein
MSRLFRVGIVMLVTLGSSRAAAQVTDFVYRVDNRLPGARGAALAGAITSDNQDVETLYWNPAGLIGVARPGVALDHRHDWDDGVYNESVALRLFRSGAHAVGIGLQVTRTGGTDATPARRFDFRQYSADLAYAYEIITDVSAGLLAGVRQGSANGQTLTGYAVSLGLIYTPDRSVSYALCVRGIGRNIEYNLHTSTGPTVPVFDETRPVTTELSSVMRYPARNRAPYLTLTVAIENNHILKELRYKGGIELLLFGNIIAARAGLINATSREVSAGLGVTLGKFRLDYAVQSQKYTARFDEVSLKAFF